MADKFIDTPPAGADAWREVWVEDRRYAPPPSKAQPAISLLRRLFRRANQPEADRQRNFNVAVLDLLVDVRREIEALREAVRADIDAVQRDIRSADDVLAADIAKTAALIPVASMRNDALVAALDQKIETVAVRLRDLTNPVIQTTAAIPASPASAADFLYRRLEDGLRGSEREVREAVAPYVDLARHHQPLFDAGCGRGELLLACQEAGIAARGCDTNERSVADLAARGLDVRLAAIPGCFEGVADASLGSIAVMHVVEHIPVDSLFALYREAARTLKPGGLLMIETPNAESMFVTGSQFWRDPTHLAPRHPAALVLLGREHGFDVQEVLPVHEFPAGTAIATRPDDPPSLQRVIEAINGRLFAPQDLRLILRKG